jgi:hypothetical protein
LERSNQREIKLFFFVCLLFQVSAGVASYLEKCGAIQLSVSVKEEGWVHTSLFILFSFFFFFTMGTGSIPPGNAQRKLPMLSEERELYPCWKSNGAGLFDGAHIFHCCISGIFVDKTTLRNTIH